MGKEQYVREMWEYFCRARARVKRFREEAGEEGQAGIQGQWQMETSAREYLEQDECCNDTDCTHRMMKQGFLAMKSGEWEEFQNTFRKEVKVSEWAFDRIKEAFEKVAKDEAKKLSTIQETCQKAQITCDASSRQRGSKEALRCPICDRIATLRWKTASCGSLRETGALFGGARFFEEKYDWKQPNRLLMVQTGESVNQAKAFGAHAVPQGLYGNRINALKLLANQQEDGDGLIQNIVTNIREGSREGLTNGLRDFIKIDNRRGSEVGYLSEGLGKFEVRRPKGSEGFPEVTVRESPDEVTLRAEEVDTWKSYINVDHMVKERWRSSPGWL